MSKIRILLLSAYDAASHVYWREGLVAAFPEYDWTVLTLPPRHFRWRLRGNSLTWAVGERDVLSRDYDLLIATSMTDLSALRGMAPKLAAVPGVLYCHENQFDYPRGRGKHSNVEPQVTTLYAALAADRVVFNSDYNRRTFLAGASTLLKQMPDCVPKGVVESLESRSSVIPVPLLEREFRSEHKPPDKDEVFSIVWNHRWEYDKAPERLALALEGLLAAKVNFKVHVLGQRFRDTPEVFERMREKLGGHLGRWGFVADEAEYRALLRRSHVVVSTSLHDFQGLAILQAVAAGCLPMVPDRLAYVDFIPRAFRYASYPDDAPREARALVDGLRALYGQFVEKDMPVAPSVDHLAWKRRRDDYSRVLSVSPGLA